VDSVVIWRLRCSGDAEGLEEGFVFGCVGVVLAEDFGYVGGDDDGAWFQPAVLEDFDCAKHGQNTNAVSGFRKWRGGVDSLETNCITASNVRRVKETSPVMRSTEATASVSKKYRTSFG
jgi:hypothetical protein